MRTKVGMVCLASVRFVFVFVLLRVPITFSVARDHLDAAPPEEAWVWIRTIKSSASRESTHEVPLIMDEHLAVLFLIELKDSVLADREDVGWDLGFLRCKALVVLTSRVDGQFTKVLTYFDLGVGGL
ncbi:hypothetical protein HG531_012841 [Fusarium graminearum]|nr:hypothetical protein HG531_012841 [Fusarium graminearum]